MSNIEDHMKYMLKLGVICCLFFILVDHLKELVYFCGSNFYYRCKHKIF